MNIAVLCVLVAALQPLFWTLLSKAGGIRAGIAYDNKAPRECAARYEGWQKRAQWAQQNSFEAFPFFASAIGFAWMSGVPQSTIESLAIAYVLSRFAYGVCYLADWHILRSATWAVGWVINIYLFVLSML